MKLSPLGLILLGLTLSSCVGLKNSPPIIKNNTFTDNNYPKIHLEFPFNIYLDDTQVQFGDNVKSYFYKMKTNDASISVYVQKEEIISGNYVFWGTDDAFKKKPFFLEKKKKGYCSTNIIKDKKYSYIEVEVRKYIGSKKLVKSNIYCNIGIIPSKEMWQEQNRETMKVFINYTIGLCDQMFPSEPTAPYLDHEGKYALLN